MKMLRLLTASAAVASIAAATAPYAYAQQITAEIRGVVSDEAGAPVSGAEVTVVDTRTGAARTITTGATGAFSARNLQSGGPYTVSIAAPSYRGQRIDGIIASIGAASVLNIDLESVSAGAVADEIVVTATRRNVAQVAIGPNSTFGLDTIQALPSISRDIRDVIRIDPRVVIDGTNDDNISCVGGNNRFNSLTIDGIQANDPFGLNASGFPARNSFPLPFDSIRETAVEFSPFDVEYGQFTGCNVNVVTQSGTNEFHGSAFGVFNSSGLTGQTLEGRNVGGDEFRDWNWGASVGGPIIKDKLFFYVSYEEVKDGGDIVNNGPIDGNFANPVGTLTTAQINEVSDILRDVYGFDSGGIATVLPEDSRRIFGRIDWQINDNHRLESTYLRVRESNTEPDGGAEFIFGNTFEIEGTEAEQYSARLFSQWTDNLSSEIRISRFDNQDLQGPVGGGEAQSANPIPTFLINDLSFGVEDDDNGVIQNGPGIFRSANDLRTQTDQIRAKIDYVAGAHTWTAGYELNQLDVFNLFAARATGEFVFNSVDDLRAGVASSVRANGSFSGDINDAAANFSRSIHTLYIQDEWQFTEALTLTLGLRYDWYASGDVPRENQAFVDRYGFSNSFEFGNLDVILPRFAFNYDAGDTLFGTTTFRGGAGIFSGSDPTVWFSNTFSNFGGGLADVRTSRIDCPPEQLTVVDANGFTGIPQCVLDEQQSQASQGLGRVDAIDPNFEIPSVVRGSFGLTHFTDFGGAAGGFFDDWRVDLDVIHTRRRNAPVFLDIALSPVGTAPDGRSIFESIDPLNAGCNATFNGQPDNPRFNNVTDACVSRTGNQDILLTNVRGRGEQGGSTSFSAIFNKGWEYDSPLFGVPSRFDLTMGYAFTSAKDVSPTTSSQATSNFEELAVAEINQPVLAPTQFVNNHNVTMAARFGQEFIKDYETSFNFFFQAIL
ncbi:MAG: TonB-dependent receptor [Pseudomonadota bacterium]